ncbi:MAG: hypothetical protein IH987_18055 [Planctomycetes bacterium]|nr:hypothetical protein [Planctomycetota bacterium]
MPKTNSSGAYEFEWAPAYLTKDDNWLEIRQRGGFENLTSESTLEVLDRATPDAIGCVVDADDKGVERRLQACQEWLGKRYVHAKKLKAGRITPGQPRLGVWIAPNNRSNGNLGRLLLDAAKMHNKGLVRSGKRFVTSLEKLEPGKWSTSREKAVLGAINQTVRPGASLAACLHSSKCWFDSSLATHAPFAKLCEFVERLTGLK